MSSSRSVAVVSIAFRSSISIALIGAGLVAGAPAHAVRVNADGHGQALIYPYYTARSTAAGNSYVTATALSQWSDKVQWSAAGNAHPNLADVSPLVSYVVEAREDGDLAYVSNWSRGPDAVSAVFMVDHVHNDFSVESTIKAATDWVLTMPTKRFHVTAARSDPPFGILQAVGEPPSRWWCHVRSLARCDGADTSWDREGQTPGACVDFSAFVLETHSCGAASVVSFDPSASAGSATSSVFNSTATDFVRLNTTWINGWYDLPAMSFSGTFYSTNEVSRLVGVAAGTTVINTLTGQATTGATVTYHGLPIVGFAAQSYSTTGLPGISANVLSSYGGVFSHKFVRRIEIQH